MSLDNIYIRRCFQLARKGEGFTRPNPMVGAVVVYNDKIIGEGYHRKFGEVHAEVNAINAVKNSSLLPKSTLYVSLEPCSHYGKTPPCAELIVSKKIPRVVIAVSDPNPKVSSKGIQMLRDNGVEVTVGILENEAHELNKAFFTNQIHRRPYIILKWAQSSDGFIDIERTSREEKPPTRISNDLTSVLAHKLRTEIQAIMVGTRTAFLDNPQLTARKWFGENPTRIVIDRENKLPADLAIFDGIAPTIVFTDIFTNNLIKKESITYIPIDFSQNVEEQIIHQLYERKICSLLVEGGTKTISSFIEKNLWDEAFVEISDTPLHNGIKVPEIQGKTIKTNIFFNSIQIRLESKTTRKFT
ncbi:MAG: bifunctional diaminohydroxyphosphoribosylaminopyrimidine deaminase/5-amino-6-(5-phosphoribosylamino)uracil reductase RibD [Dysgonamonadaceae bacterium]|jgi:diaminohydroxyphosphoribosylaminopyrimidine deaminase/5-amino-6-(5-phosphoribosylamino)uracil reductase|nr:bifunctional diaminohydroxyphosphoribosylaminopyrimidine deaminase/5-amino-6-(5-phosphoribosylamino)uracil reductase RibD [Dysgonamonadaceae bacterium]